MLADANEFSMRFTKRYDTEGALHSCACGMFFVQRSVVFFVLRSGVFCLLLTALGDHARSWRGHDTHIACE